VAALIRATTIPRATTETRRRIVTADARRARKRVDRGASLPQKDRMNPNLLYGTAGDSLPAITLRTIQRGSWDDFGTVEHPEQEVWFHRWLRARGERFATRYPGEFTWPDAASRDRAWEALSAVLRAPSTAAPSHTASRTVGVDEARAVSQGLAARYFELLATLTGCNPNRFERYHHELLSDDVTPQRKERWKCVDGAETRYVTLLAAGLGSGVGVHGEEVTLTLNAPLSHGRTASVYARIDLRTGGVVLATVAGVIDGEAIAARCVAP
jgi:hypothetical protein